jgi:prepilin-type N-terminal cleavage/methylation domain-containing protein
VPMTVDGRGLTLLEVLVALVLLTVVGLGFLAIVQQGRRLIAASSGWSELVEYASDGLELVKLEPATAMAGRASEALPDGFRREVVSRPWQPGIALVTVAVEAPNGTRFELRGLAPVDAAMRPAGLPNDAMRRGPW